jgi:hypothetical protein
VNCWIGVERAAGRRIVRVAGELAAAQVPELTRACACGDEALEIDLHDLVGADTAGIDALRRLRAQGARLVRIPGYFALKLDAPASH